MLYKSFAIDTREVCVSLREKILHSELLELHLQVHRLLKLETRQSNFSLHFRHAIHWLNQLPKENWLLLISS
jgi:hypothetical protein